MLRSSHFRVIAPVVCVFFLACSAGDAGNIASPVGEGPGFAVGAPQAAGSGKFKPVFDAGDFVDGIDHPYLGFTPGRTFTYMGETEDGVETVEVFVTFDAKEIIGVTTTVVRDRVYLEGELIEDTFDWYAQDKYGNVWYFGEDSKEYEGGVLVSTEGSWEAGKDGALPGVLVPAPANLKIGMSYQQEDAPDVAEDMAKVLSLKKSVSVPYGDFDDCLQTMEWTPLEPGEREFKFYAYGVGLVLELQPRGGRGRVELTGVSD